MYCTRIVDLWDAAAALINNLILYTRVYTVELIISHLHEGWMFDTGGR